MEIISLNKKAPKSRLDFYSIPPTETLSLNDVENLAIERLKILRRIESVAQDYVKNTKDYIEKLHEEFLTCSDFSRSLMRNSDSDSAQDIKNDNLSHFILKLAYCRSDELSKWFIHQEIDLFNFRLQIEMKNKKFISDIMTANNIKIGEASESEKKFTSSHQTVYKVKVFDVLDLIKNRKIYVLKGMAFLLDKDISSLITAHFRTMLSHSLSLLRLSIPQIDEDSRLIPILSTLDNRYLGKDYSKTQVNEKITCSQIDFLCQKSFPPCMQKIHKTLNRDHHLRHGARMQYGLFLKGIGVSMEESLKFFKIKFQEKIDSETFNKKYSYSIRHNYGQEGKRVSYNPYNCVKIATSNLPQEGDCHGCPFQSSNLDLMLQHLRRTTKATEEQLTAIVTKARLNQFQISCKNYFRLVHDLRDDYPISINHPNEYFEESRKILAGNSQSLF